MLLRLKALPQSDKDYNEGVVKGCGSYGQEGSPLSGEKWGEVSGQDGGDVEDEDGGDAQGLSNTRASHVPGILPGAPFILTTTL